MRANYVRSFYLPEHQPMPSSYISYFQSRLQPFFNKPNYCECGRERKEGGTRTFCDDCVEILVYIKDQKLNDSLLVILKRFLCNVCQKRFPDEQTLKSHCQFSHARSD